MVYFNLTTSGMLTIKLYFFLLLLQYNKSVPGTPCTIDPDNDDHEAYLAEFKSMVMAKMKNSIDKDLVNDPDVIKGRKKTVQVIAFTANVHFLVLQISCFCVSHVIFFGLRFHFRRLKHLLILDFFYQYENIMC